MVLPLPLPLPGDLTSVEGEWIVDELPFDDGWLD